MTIGIFTAMQKEAVTFLAGGATVEQVGDFQISRFTLAGHDAVLICPPHVGQVAAAAATQLLVTRFHADVVFNFGVVGALAEHVSALDVVYVRDVVHYEMDTSQVDGMPVGAYDCFDSIAVAANEFLLNKAVAAHPFPLVRCASGDKFVNDPDQKRRLREQFAADVCDMESAAVLFTCRFNHVPCLIVKCISDTLFGGAGDYRRNVRKACEGFLQLATSISANL